MFAYCRNNPITRKDKAGAADYAFLDDSPHDEEDILDIGRGGGPGGAPSASNGDIVSGASGANHGNPNAQSLQTSNAGNSNIGGNNGSFANNGLPQNGIEVSSDQVLDMAINFLGEGYTEVSPGRFVSADGIRQVRMGTADLLGLHAGAPHVNFNLLSPQYKNVHVFFHD